MTRNSGAKIATQSRIRFVMVEAELSDGDIGQITQAIQNALRSPVAPPVKRLAATSPVTESAPEPEVEQDREVDLSEIAELTPTSVKTRNPRRPAPTPNVVQIDMNADPSFASFASGKDSSSQHKKFLITTAWLKDHRGIDAVTADHIYTCFRSIGWSVGIPDFAQPLRDLKRRKFFNRNSNGEYEINHLGLDFVKKLGSSNGAP
jgi:hypothetical protein